jgi:hypothetical protein
MGYWLWVNLIQPAEPHLVVPEANLGDGRNLLPARLGSGPSHTMLFSLFSGFGLGFLVLVLGFGFWGFGWGPVSGDGLHSGGALHLNSFDS